VIRTQEVELKLEVTPSDADRCRALEVLGDPKRLPVEQITAYFDTPTGNLRKAGFSLRIRRRGGSYWQTVKHRGGEAGGFSSRAEWEAELGGPDLDFTALASTPVGALLSRHDMKKRLTRVSETRVRRTTWLVAQGKSQVEVILDEGEVVSGSRREPISELELELKRGNRADLFALAKQIGRHVAPRMGVNSKSERGFRLLEGHATRPRKAQRVRLDPGMDVAQAFAAIVQSCLRHFRLNEGLISAKGKGGALHQSRVAIRRLRSAFSLFRPVVADAEFDRLREELRAFGLCLGEARNLDVMLAEPANAKEQGGRELRRRLRAQRAEAYARVADMLAGPRIPRLILEITAWAETGAWRDSEAARAPIPPFAVERLDRRWKRVKRDAKSFDKLDAEERHRLRIDVKKLRYACEFFAGLLPPERRGERKIFVGTLEAIQESLGRLNDFETALLLAPELGEAVDAEREQEAESLLALTRDHLKRLRAL
jgi:inorganic triphosphatase YgiF